ncbi:MAG: hypothetical protein R2865_00270 [Deinococcales bacterium]
MKRNEKIEQSHIDNLWSQIARVMADLSGYAVVVHLLLVIACEPCRCIYPALGLHLGHGGFRNLD